MFSLPCLSYFLTQPGTPVHRMVPPIFRVGLPFSTIIGNTCYGYSKTYQGTIKLSHHTYSLCIRMYLDSSSLGFIHQFELVFLSSKQGTLGH